MAETQAASTGYNGKVYIHDGTALYLLVGVTSIKLPNQTRERVDASTLADLRPVSIPGRYADGEASVGLIYRPGSTTDTLLLASTTSAALLAMKIVIPKADGTAAFDITFSGYVLGYEVDDMSVDSAMSATVTISVATATTQTVSP